MAVTRLGAAYVALVCTVSGALTGAALAFRWLSQSAEKFGGVQ